MAAGVKHVEAIVDQMTATKGMNSLYLPHSRQSAGSAGAPRETSEGSRHVVAACGRTLFLRQDAVNAAAVAGKEHIRYQVPQRAGSDG